MLGPSCESTGDGPKIPRTRYRFSLEAMVGAPPRQSSPTAKGQVAPHLLWSDGINTKALQFRADGWQESPVIEAALAVQRLRPNANPPRFCWILTATRSPNSSTLASERDTPPSTGCIARKMTIG